MIGQPSRYFFFALILAASLALLSACSEPRATGANEFVVADVFATPGKSLATAELSPTPMTSPQAGSLLPTTPAPTLPLPTVVVLDQPTLPMIAVGPSPTPANAPTGAPTQVGCAAPPPLPFAAVWQNIPQAQTMMRCPAGNPQPVSGVWQAFEHGVMFWRGSDHSIFIISDLAIRQGQTTDKWWRIEDTWQSSEPESDPSLQPPASMRQPVRGFGKVWRNNGFVREAVGWAVGDEVSLDSQWLSFEGGWMMAGPNNSPIYVMVPLDALPYTNGLHLGPQG